MTRFTHNSSRSLFIVAMRNVTLALFLVVFGASAARAQSKAYVSNGSDNTVSVIDTATNTVIATVAVGINPSALAVTPNGALVYVPNTASDNVSVISGATNTLVATVAVGPSPFAAAITPDGAFVYVTNTGDGTVSVISAATNTVATQQYSGGHYSRWRGASVYSVSNEDTGSHRITHRAGASLSHWRHAHAFVNSGALTQAEAQPLIDAANALRASNGC